MVQGGRKGRSWRCHHKLRVNVKDDYGRREEVIKGVERDKKIPKVCSMPKMAY